WFSGNALGICFDLHGRAAGFGREHRRFRLQEAGALQHAWGQRFAGGSDGAAFTGLGEQERTYGFHAGEVETAFLLSAIPQLVHTGEYTVNYIADIAKPELLRPENASATFAWLTRDIAPSGVMGDPNPATAEKGALWIEEAAKKVAAALTAMAAYENWHKP